MKIYWSESSPEDAHNFDQIKDSKTNQDITMYLVAVTVMVADKDLFFIITNTTAYLSLEAL